MKILGLESASKTASVALLTEDGLIGEFSVNYHRTHSETLLPMTDALLTTAGVDFPEVDALAVSVGPGSFTGLRIGISLAKGLAFPADKPVVAVPTLDAMAFAFEGSADLLCPILDARRGEVYAGIYRFVNGEFTIVREADALDLREFVEIVRGIAAETGPAPLFFGDGLEVHEKAIRALYPEAKIAAPQLKFSRAGAVAALGLRMFKEGRAMSAEGLSPIYLRMSQAERERLEEGLSIAPEAPESIEPVNRKIGE